MYKKGSEIHLADQLRRATYWDFKVYITIRNDLLFKGDQLIVPELMRAEMLKAIHQGHFGSEA